MTLLRSRDSEQPDQRERSDDHKTITVGSRAHTAIRIQGFFRGLEQHLFGHSGQQQPAPAQPHPAQPHVPNPDHAAPPKTAIINGNTHPDAVNGVGITRNVDAGLFREWLRQNPQHQDVLFEMSDEDVARQSSPAANYGFEPGLAALANNKENRELAAKGSQAPAETPVKAEDMAATSDAPQDDTPRSDVPLGPEAPRQTPQTAPAAGRPAHDSGPGE